MAAEVIGERPESERRAFYQKVLGNTVRGVLAITVTVITLTTVGLILFQLNQLNTALEKLDANYNATISQTDRISNISVLAAYCAKLPESNTVAKIQQCIETNIKVPK
jgi:hypothetical protein